MTGRIIYARGFPYGAPLAMVRGGATRRDDVKAFLREAGFRWEGDVHAWNYLNRPEFRDVLIALRDRLGCEVVPKAGLDPSYLIDLDEGVQR